MNRKEEADLLPDKVKDPLFHVNLTKRAGKNNANITGEIKIKRNAIYMKRK